MNKCLVSGCGIFHAVMSNCKVAKNQLAAGTLAEPWLTANRIEKLSEKKAVEKGDVETPLDQPPIQVATKKADRPERQLTVWDGTDRRAKIPACPVCEAKRLKNLESVRKYRAKKPA